MKTKLIGLTEFAQNVCESWFDDFCGTFNECHDCLLAVHHPPEPDFGISETWTECQAEEMKDCPVVDKLWAKPNLEQFLCRVMEDTCVWN